MMIEEEKRRKKGVVMSARIYEGLKFDGSEVQLSPRRSVGRVRVLALVAAVEGAAMTQRRVCQDQVDPFRRIDGSWIGQINSECLLSTGGCPGPYTPAQS